MGKSILYKKLHFNLITMNKNILVPLIVGVLVATTALAAEELTGYLANLQFNVENNPSEVYTANIDLGTIYPNEVNNYTESTSMTIGQGGVYSITVLNNSVIQNVFTWFNITISILNGTSQMKYHIIDGNGIYYPNNVTIYLNPGTYNVEISIRYQVLPYPETISYDNPILAVYYQY